MGMIDKIKNFFGELFDGEASHSTDKHEMFGTGFDCEEILGIDRGNAGEFLEFCDMNVSDGSKIETVIDFDRETGGETRIEITQEDGSRIEVSLDRETGTFEATEYRPDGSRYEYDIDGTREIKLGSINIPEDYTLDNPWCGKEYDADGKLISSTEPDGSCGKIETEYTYDSEGKLQETVASEYPHQDDYAEKVETCKYTYHDNGEVAKIDREVEQSGPAGEVYTDSTSYREDGTKEYFTSHETEVGPWSETTTDKRIEYSADGERVEREIVTEREVFDDDYYDDDYKRTDSITTKTEMTERTDSITTKTEITDEYKRTEVIERGYPNGEHTVDTEYADGSKDSRVYDARDIGFVETYYDSEGRIEAVTKSTDGRTERTEIFGDNDRIETVEISRDGHLDTVEHYDADGTLESRDTFGQDNEVISSSEFSYDGDKVVETVYGADGEYEKTITTEPIDDKVQLCIETSKDGSEREWAVVDGETYTLEEVKDVDGGKEYSFERDISNSSTDGSRYLEITIDEKGDVVEKTTGYGCEKIGIDRQGEDTVQWTEGRSEKIEYHEDGSRTETVSESVDGYRGSDTGSSAIVERTYDKDGKLEKEVYSKETHEAFEDRESGHGFVRITEYGDDGEKTETIIHDLDASDFERAIENPEGFDREVVYTEDGDVTREFVAAGETFEPDNPDVSETPDVREEPDSQTDIDVPEVDHNDGEYNPDRENTPDGDTDTNGEEKTESNDIAETDSGDINEEGNPDTDDIEDDDGDDGQPDE